MRALFTTVLSLSLSGSIVIILLLALGPLLRRRVSRRWQYYVWLIAAARLLLPLGPAESPVGKLFASSVPAAPGQYVLSPLPAGEGGGEAPVTPGIPESPPSGVPEAPPEPDGTGQGVPLRQQAGRALQALLPGGCLAVALALLGWKILLYCRCLRRLRRGWTPVTEVETLSVLREAKAIVGVRRQVGLAVSPEADTPMLLGLLHPCVLLPPGARPGADLRRALLHELVHCRRWDIACKWLMQLAVCLHWFNPLVRRMAWEADRCCELSCDEAVLRLLPEAERRAYGDTLLRSARPGGTWGGPVGAGLTENGKLLKERLDAIMNFKAITRRTALLSLLLALALAVGALGLGGSVIGRPAAPAAPADGGTQADPDAAFRYTHKGFYQSPYLFQLGWNLPAGREDKYASTVLTLSDGSRLTVYLGPACGDIAGDQEVLSALTALLERLRREETAFPPVRPLLASLEVVGSSTPAALAQRCYEENQLPSFGAAFCQLSQAEQEDWLDRIYDDGRIAFFGLAISELPAASAQTARIAKRAYADGQISFFSLLAEQCMEEAALRQWLSQAEADGKTSFRAVLYNILGEDDRKESMETELAAWQRAAYQALGITDENGVYYYQGQRVHILLDLRADSSFFNFLQDPAGTVDIQILRDQTGNITGVAYLTQAEYQSLFGETEQEKEELREANGAIHIPIAIPSLAAGELVDLGTYVLSPGDRIQYAVSAASGSALQVAFSAPGDASLNPVYYSVTNTRQGSQALHCLLDTTLAPPVAPGRFRLFLRAPEGALQGIAGSITLTPAAKDGALRIDWEELPETVRQAAQQCAPSQWYVIHFGGRQYLYCSYLPYSYAYAPQRTAEGWRIDIAKLDSRKSGYALLLLEDEAPVSLYCDGVWEQAAELYL